MAVVFHSTEGELLPTREELKKENEELKKQVLDAQLALVELYEMILPATQ
ncbi:MAG: hypothetical protein KHY76_10480 [Butyricicoccus pullicaecorum]|nr:hypothetical protein [Butyricicoccus pullicaecorum]